MAVDVPTPSQPAKPHWQDRLTRFLTPHRLRVIQRGLLILAVVSVALPGYLYFRYARWIDQQLSAGPFSETVNVYAAPRPVTVGDAATADQIAAELDKAGYGRSANFLQGWYGGDRNRIEIHPGARSYIGQQAAALTFSGGKISRIESLPQRRELKVYELEPRLVANLSEEGRERRRLARFHDFPNSLVNAVVSVEDKRFFQHSGFDPIRILKAAYVDVREGRKEQGASTLSMQLARNLWLTSQKRFRRKFEELLIAMHLETRLSKQQIFEYYGNQIYLGRRGTFNIHGFGEAAQAFFGKDIRSLTPPESALLAGIIQRPSYFDPYRHPERAQERRNLVLRLMEENGYLSPTERAAACAAPLELFEGYSDSLDSQYFVDMIRQELGDRVSSEAGNVYTSLDLRLQAAAEEAIRLGMQKLDRITRKTGRAEAALVALDPRTGEIKALVGGREYARSQLNRAVARRQPGSVFKPFVFAAALNTAVAGGDGVITPATTVIDEPTQWVFQHRVYEPGNYGGTFSGEVTLRRAMIKSLNIPTIKVAEMAGYQAVVDLARRAGFNEDFQPTPALALGAYDATPLEVAGAYTVFANGGWRVRPALVRRVRGRDGAVAYTHTPEKRYALDPRVAFMVTDMLEDVLRRGTGARARSMGFRAPAAGKTGTSRDGWFVGFTTELICVVWVGFDDGRELGLEGSKSALPIWTEFMKRAHQLLGYDHPRNFSSPKGLVRIDVDPETGLLVGPDCEEAFAEYFISGTQPIETCPHDRILEPAMVGVADRAAPDTAALPGSAVFYKSGAPATR